MSRLLWVAFAAACLSCSSVQAQQLSDVEIEAMIEKQRRQVAFDAEGCLKYPEEDEENVIIVCGEDPENRRQRIFQGESDEDRIRLGEAVSTTRAGRCIGSFLECGHRLPVIYSIGFGDVKPMAIDHDEVMKGLPDADMVVPEGTSEAERNAAEKSAQQPE
ncbi:MAG: hypothetical protein V3V15_11940 [Sphingorhabdus sp.]